MMNIRAALSGTLRRMHYVKRYSSVPAIQPENVAEHSWQVAMLSYLIGKDLQENGVTVLMERLLVGALVHDVSEAMSGDIIRSFKHSSPAMTRATQDADYDNMVKLSEELGIKEESEHGHLHYSWSRAKDGSLEGHIVKLADLLCVVSYCASEHRLGNLQVGFIMKDVYESNLAMWHGHDYLGVYVDRLFPNKHYTDAYNLHNPIMERF